VKSELSPATRTADLILYHDLMRYSRPQLAVVFTEKCRVVVEVVVVLARHHVAPHFIGEFQHGTAVVVNGGTPVGEVVDRRVSDRSSCSALLR
jgi:hypothetical protein